MNLVLLFVSKIHGINGKENNHFLPLHNSGRSNASSSSSSIHTNTGWSDSQQEEKAPSSISMADVEQYLHSIGMTLDGVCEYHRHQHQHVDDQIFKPRGLQSAADDEVVSPVSDAGTEEGAEEEGESEMKTKSFYIKNGLMATLCIIIAALAAGLTMGLLSQELLDLRIKEMASSNLSERNQAKALVPLIQDHHRLVRFILVLRASFHCFLIGLIFFSFKIHPNV